MPDRTPKERIERLLEDARQTAETLHARVAALEAASRAFDDDEPANTIKLPPGEAYIDYLDGYGTYQHVGRVVGEQELRERDATYIAFARAILAAPSETSKSLNSNKMTMDVWDLPADVYLSALAAFREEAE